MAEKKHRSQAEKAAATKSRQKAPQKSNSKKDMQQKNGNKTEIPVRVITSIIFIVLFILFIFTLRVTKPQKSPVSRKSSASTTLQPGPASAVSAMPRLGLRK